jgi:hypothetical protein
MKEKQARNQPFTSTSTSNNQQELLTSLVPPSDQANITPGFDLSSNAGNLEDKGNFEEEIDPSLL